MDGTRANGHDRPPERFRWVFFFAVCGDLRFISHHDTLRLFRRALARTAVPLRFSQGFNPQPKLSIPLPRPVGIASDAEAIVVETSASIDPDAVLRRLEHDTPADLHMLGVRRLEPSEKLRPRAVRYRIDSLGPSVEDVEERARRLLETDVVHVERKNPKLPHAVRVDIRPYIADVAVVDGAVEMTLLVTGGGTARPAEIAGLLGYPADAINHCIRRREIQWQ